MKRHSHKFLFALAIAVLLFVSGVYFFIFHQISDDLEQTAKDRASIENNQAEIAKRHSFAKEAITSKTKLDNLTKRFITSTDVVKFIEAIEVLGQRGDSKVTLGAIDVKYGDDPASLIVGKAEAKVSVEGSWRSVMRVLALAETLPYKVEIMDVRLDSIKETDKKTPAYWKLNFTIDASLISASSTTSTTK